MDSAQQAIAEKRVRNILIDPLLARGLGKPKGFTKQQDFDLMVEKTLCPKLAYMAEENLAALEEQIAAHPVGRDNDQLPIPNDILRQASEIQPPGDEASPLMRAVFAAALGFDALADDWAPELLRHLRKERRWPSGRAIVEIKRLAHQARDKAADITGRQGSGGVVSDADLNWLESRDQARRKCEQIRALADGGTA